MTLDSLTFGQPATIVAISDTDALLEMALREIGFAERDTVELMHTGPLGRRPLCFRLNETLVALRLDEARAITIELAE
ncbi:FeoA family protein [Henriciella aquimarina]|uniref:FeoA family protein n=1 Tax=Henriciella aquimarina TaxID=545261 RepID=UPI001301EAA1|nr:FeoA family protein [Henriciella aquimarina]